MIKIKIEYVEVEYIVKTTICSGLYVCKMIEYVRAIHEQSDRDRQRAHVALYMMQ